MVQCNVSHLGNSSFDDNGLAFGGATTFPGIRHVHLDVSLW